MLAISLPRYLKDPPESTANAFSLKIKKRSDIPPFPKCLDFFFFFSFLERILFCFLNRG